MRTWSLILTVALLPACKRAPVPTRTTLEVVSPGTKIHGKTYGEWSAVWVQFMNTIPSSDSPFLHEGKCEVGQSGPVWFLAPKRGTSPVVVTRYCAVPAGKYLFFPVQAVHADNVGFAAPKTVDELRAGAREIIDAYTPKCWLDGKELPGVTVSSPYRVVSPVFKYTVPAESVWGYRAGMVLDPVVSDGVWIMLEPLAPSRHTIRFASSSVAPPSVYDITYNIDIVPPKK